MKLMLQQNGRTKDDRMVHTGMNNRYATLPPDDRGPFILFKNDRYINAGLFSNDQHPLTKYRPVIGAYRINENGELIKLDETTITNEDFIYADAVVLGEEQLLSTSEVVSAVTNLKKHDRTRGVLTVLTWVDARAEYAHDATSIEATTFMMQRHFNVSKHLHRLIDEAIVASGFKVAKFKSLNKACRKFCETYLARLEALQTGSMPISDEERLRMISTTVEVACACKAYMALHAKPSKQNNILEGYLK